MRIGIFLVMTLSNLCLLFSAGIGRMPDIGISETKQDSIIWVANPVPDQEMKTDDVLEIDISYSFSWEPDSIEFYSIDVVVNSVSSVSPVKSAYYTSSDNILRIETKPDIYGYAYIEYTANTNFGTATDEFLVRVEDVSYEWRSNGSDFSFLPDNCIGSGTSEWKAASVFDFGTSRYDLRTIEFGYGRDGTASWEIVVFDGILTDSILYSGTTQFKGDQPGFIENLSAELTGQIAVVFTTDSNFMATDPSGNSTSTMVYSEGEGWQYLSDISEDYEGAWYIRLLVLESSGIDESFTAAKNPYLIKNYPNPFNNETVITWNMIAQGDITVNIYNSKGELIRKYDKGLLSAGKHSIVFNSSGLNSGVYYCELTVNGEKENYRRMLYLK